MPIRPEKSKAAEKEPSAGTPEALKAANEREADIATVSAASEYGLAHAQRQKAEARAAAAEEEAAAIEVAEEAARVAAAEEALEEEALEEPASPAALAKPLAAAEEEPGPSADAPSLAQPGKQRTEVKILLTDVESNFERIRKLIDDATRMCTKLRIKNPEIKIIFIGDLTDKPKEDAKGTIATVEQFSKWKKAGILEAFIAGNRDASKIRLARELTNISHLKDLLVENDQPFWLEKQGQKEKDKKNPVNFLQTLLESGKKDLFTQEFLPTLRLSLRDAGCADEEQPTHEQLKTAYKGLGLGVMRSFKHYWMLKETMGCPESYEMMRKEMAALRQHNVKTVTNEMVDMAFLQLLLPEEVYMKFREDKLQKFTAELQLDQKFSGMLSELICDSQLVKRVENAMLNHSGPRPGNFLMNLDGTEFPAKKQGEADSDYVDRWINSLNGEWKAEVNKEYQAISDSTPIPKGYDCSVNRQSTANKETGEFTHMTDNAFSDEKGGALAQPFEHVFSDYHREVFKGAQIVEFVHGHQPVGNMPLTWASRGGPRHHMLDTSMSQDPVLTLKIGDQIITRGSVTHKDRSVMHYSIDSEDQNIGKMLASGFRVVARLLDADGNDKDNYIVAKRKIMGGFSAEDVSIFVPIKAFADLADLEHAVKCELRAAAAEDKAEKSLAKEAAAMACAEAVMEAAQRQIKEAEEEIEALKRQLEEVREAAETSATEAAAKIKALEARSTIEKDEIVNLSTTSYMITWNTHHATSCTFSPTKLSPRTAKIVKFELAVLRWSMGNPDLLQDMLKNSNGNTRRTLFDHGVIDAQNSKVLLPYDDWIQNKIDAKLDQGRDAASPGRQQVSRQPSGGPATGGAGRNVPFHLSDGNKMPLFGGSGNTPPAAQETSIPSRDAGTSRAAGAK